jgi:HPt (histidine-containing phosphotransfer) domain-containing protein
MSDDIAAMFIPRFAENARAYLATATEATTRRDPTALAVVVRHMHSIAGEAGLLGLRDVVNLARDGEARAKRLSSEPTDQAVDAMTRALGALRAAIDDVVARHPAPAPRPPDG